MPVSSNPQPYPQRGMQARDDEYPHKSENNERESISFPSRRVLPWSGFFNVFSEKKVASATRSLVTSRQTQ
jgi:hypothetical protein